MFSITVFVLNVSFHGIQLGKPNWRLYIWYLYSLYVQIDFNWPRERFWWNRSAGLVERPAPRPLFIQKNHFSFLTFLTFCIHHKSLPYLPLYLSPIPAAVSSSLALLPLFLLLLPSPLPWFQLPIVPCPCFLLPWRFPCFLDHHPCSWLVVASFQDKTRVDFAFHCWLAGGLYPLIGISVPGRLLWGVWFWLAGGLCPLIGTSVPGRLYLHLALSTLCQVLWCGVAISQDWNYYLLCFLVLVLLVAFQCLSLEIDW